MWLLLAFLSAALLGFYDVFKKQSLKNNAVIPVLTLNTLFSSLIFLPFIVLSAWRPDTLEGGLFFVPVAGISISQFPHQPHNRPSHEQHSSGTCSPIRQSNISSTPIPHSSQHPFVKQ